MITRKITKKQYEELEGLYFHLFVNKWKATESEKAETRKNVEYAFNLCDKAGIPYSIQNIVIGLSEVKSNKDFYFKTLMEKSGVIVE